MREGIWIAANFSSVQVWGQRVEAALQYDVIDVTHLLSAIQTLDTWASVSSGSLGHRYPLLGQPKSAMWRSKSMVVSPLRDKEWPARNVTADVAGLSGVPECRWRSHERHIGLDMNTSQNGVTAAMTDPTHRLAQLTGSVPASDHPRSACNAVVVATPERG